MLGWLKSTSESMMVVVAISERELVDVSGLINSQARSWFINRYLEVRQVGSYNVLRGSIGGKIACEDRYKEAM